MPGEICLTPPVRVTTTGAQELRLALDVLAFDVLDLELRVLNLTGSGPSLRLGIDTGMDVYSDFGWVTVSGFSLVSSSPYSEMVRFTQFLRYIRWNVTTFGGTASPSATFLIRGMGRSWSKVAFGGHSVVGDFGESNAGFQGDAVVGDSGGDNAAFRGDAVGGSNATFQGDVLVGPWCTASAQMRRECP